MAALVSGVQWLRKYQRMSWRWQMANKDCCIVGYVADWSFGVGALMYVRLRHTGEVRHPQPQTRRWGFKQHNPAVKSLLERRRFLLRYLWRGRWPV